MTGETEQLPSNVDAEQAVLGALLLNNKVLSRLRGLEPEHFFDPLHARIFSAARERIEGGEYVSPVTLKGALASDPDLHALGGPVYLARLAEATISILAANDYAAQILDTAARRQVIDGARHATDQAARPDVPLNTALEGLEAVVDTARESTMQRPATVPFGRAMHAAAIALDRAFHEGPGTPTGLATLDDEIGGLMPGDLTIIAGRPAMGKTAVALHLARRIAERGRHVVFWSGEMQASDLGMRIASDMARARTGALIAYRDIRQGRLDEEAIKIVFRVGEDIADWPLDIIEPHIRNLSSVRAEVRRSVARARAAGQEIGAIFLDYLGLMQGVSARSEYERITKISGSLKTIAAENDAPVIALSQLSRAVEHREDKRPHMADLRDSGSIEQDADNVLMAYRPEYYVAREKPESGDPGDLADWHAEMSRVEGVLELIIAKQRNGPTGVASLRCDLATNSIWDG